MSYFLSRCLSLLTVTFIFRGPLLTSAVKGKIFHGTSEIFKHYHNIHGHLQNTRIYFNRLAISNQNSKRFFKSEKSCYHFTIYVIVVLGEDCNTEIKEKKILFFFLNNLFPVIFYIFKQVQPLDYRTPAVLRWISCHIMTYVFVFPFLIFLKIYRNYKYFC